MGKDMDQHTLALLQQLAESLTFAIQRREAKVITGDTSDIVWKTKAEVRGKTAAHARMAELKGSEDGGFWRVIALNEAQRVEEGIRIGKAIAEAERVRGDMYMPENL